MANIILIFVFKNRRIYLVNIYNDLQTLKNGGQGQDQRERWKETSQFFFICINQMRKPLIWM